MYTQVQCCQPYEIFRIFTDSLGPDGPEKLFYGKLSVALRAVVGAHATHDDKRALLY